MAVKKTIKKEILKKDFRVTIFGSARIKKSDKHYKQVYELAKMIGEEGIDIVTGGGPGLMEAANKGHKAGSKKSKAHSIGLGIKLPWENKPNKNLDISKTYNRFSKRLDSFMSLSNVFIAAPGGIGTMLEVFYTWQLMQVKHTCNTPLILMGDMWPGLIKWMSKKPLKHQLFNKEDLNIIFLAKNPKEALKMVNVAYENYKQGNKKYCLNYKRYKLY